MTPLALDNYPALGLVDLLDSLPDITGPDDETIAFATLLRGRCLGDLAVTALGTWREGDGPTMAEVVLYAWRGRVTALVEKTDAVWWLINGTDGGMYAAAAAVDVADGLGQQLG